MAVCVFPGEKKPLLVPNQTQTCCIPCDSGDDFCISVVGGAVLAKNQALANQIAKSLACQRAAEQIFCLGDLPRNFCIGVQVSSQLHISRGVAPLIWSVAGSPIPGVNTTVSPDTRSLQFKGTPTTAGTFGFSVVVTDQQGLKAARAYTVVVFGFTTSTELPNFTKNTPYTFTFTSVGGSAPYVYAVVNGTLPAGLTLTSDGRLIGTPTVDSAGFQFTLSVTDAGGLVCLKQFHFGTNCDPSAVAALEATFAVAASTVVFAGKTGTAFAIEGIGRSTILEINAATGAVINTINIGASGITDLFYEDVHQHLYVSYADAFSNSRFASIDPTTRLVIGSVATIGTPITYMAYDPVRDNIWGVRGNLLYRINPTTLATTFIDFSTPNIFSGTGGLAYCIGQDRIAVAGFHPATPFQSICIVNPATMTYASFDFPFDLGGEGLAYCPDNSLLYMGYSTLGVGSVLVINPVGGVLVTSISTLPDPQGIVFNACTRRIQAITQAPGAGQNLVAWWINPTTQSVITSIPTASAITQFSTNLQLWFDNATSRCLYGTGNSLLKFK